MPAHAGTILTCKHPEITGLYQQCEEVQVLEIFHDRVRVYSKPQKKVYTLPRAVVFVAEVLSNSEKISAQQNIVIPAHYLWNSSDAGFHSLCTIDADQGRNHLIQVSCGRYKREKIAKESVLKIRPYTSEKGIQQSGVSIDSKVD